MRISEFLEGTLSIVKQAEVVEAVKVVVLGAGAGLEAVLVGALRVLLF